MHSFSNTEFQRNKFNTFIQKLNPQMFGKLEMSYQEYTELVSTNIIPKSFQEQLDKIKNQNGVIYTEYTIGNEIHFLLNGKAVSEKIVRVDTESCVMYTPTIKLTVKYLLTLYFFHQLKFLKHHLIVHFLTIIRLGIE